MGIRLEAAVVRSISERLQCHALGREHDNFARLAWLSLNYRRAGIIGRGQWIGVGFLIAFITIPFKLFGARMADIRVIPAALLILPAFLSVRPAKRPISGIIVSTLVVLNAGYTAYVWLSYRSDYAEMKASFA